MKNRLFLAFVVLFCLFFTTHVGYAQSTNAETSDTDAKISFSDTYENKDVSKDKSKVVMSRFLFKDTLGNIYALKMLERENFSSDKVYIEKYTPDLKQVFDKELPLASVGGSLRYDAVLMLKGQIYVLADCRNPTTYFVYAIKINNDGQADTPIRLAEFASGSSKGRCTIKISKDSSKIMVSPLLLHEKVNGRKSTLDDVSVLVFDNNLKLLWKKETTTLRKVKTYGIASPPIQREITANFGVDSKGQILTVARLKSDKKGDDNLLPHLCISDARGGNKNFPLDLNQKEVLAFDFLETTDPDQLIILGTYSVRTHDGYFDKKPEANGTFFIRIDTQTGIIVSQSVNPFSQEIYKFLDINNRKQENGEGITNLELTNYTTTSKNNIILVIEESVNTVFHSNVSDYPFHASSTMFNIK